MRVAIIGAGRVGSTLGRGLAAAGHAVYYGLRDPGGEVPEALRHPGASALDVAGAVAASEAVILTVPRAAVPEALAAAGDFGGRPLLDATNPIGPGFTLTLGHSDSGAEEVARLAPGARVVKVFNSTGVENMAQPVYPGGRALMLACADDDGARAVALTLAADLGFEALPFGPLSNARLLEPLALTWIQLAHRFGQGRGFALGLLRR